MFNRIKNTITTKAGRHYVRVMASAILGVLIGGYIAYDAIQNLAPAETETVPTQELSAEPITQESVYERSAPKRLSIPKINLETDFVPPLGLNEDRTVEVPDTYDEVGWYKHGATPGETGTAVILGHVDSYEGPAVFFSLGQLEEGDEVQVEREDGTTATFVVTGKEKVSQDDFPTLRVYGKTDYPSLRLVTCSGTYDRGTLKYSHNLIVYAELKE